MREPFFYASKNTWYVWLGDKKMSLRVQGEGSKAEAWEAWHKLMAQPRPEPEPKPVPKQTPTVKDVLGAYLSDCEGRVKPTTVECYRTLYKAFQGQYGAKQAHTLTPGQVEAFAKAKPTWGDSTRHDFLASLCAAFRWSERTGLLPDNPLRHTRKPSIRSRGASALISPDTHAKLLAVARKDFRPFLMLLHLTGARPSEVASITAENFDERQGLVRLAQHKTMRHGKQRTIFLPDEAIAILVRQKQQYGSGFLLRSRYGLPWTGKAIRYQMLRLRQKAGVKATAYGYRHTFATDALANGVPDAHVAELLGHASTTMLHQHYSHLHTKVEAMRASLDKVR